MRKKPRAGLPDNTVLNLLLILFREQTFPKIIQIALLEALEKSGIKILFLDEEGYSIVLEILKKYSDRKLSFTDASLVYILENYGIENMASYDEKSFSGLVARILGKSYANTLPKEEIYRIISLTKKTSHIKF